MGDVLTIPSAVVKASVFHEAISDWLVPWYHYIPINYDYIELYSVLLYFFGTEDATGTGTPQPAHDDELRAMAERSREWAESQLGLEQHKVSCGGEKAHVSGATPAGRSMDRSQRTDAQVYMYRLCLEWGRITSEDRGAMTYEE